MKLEIEFLKPFHDKHGNEHKDARVYLVSTKKREPITIFKLALLVNQITVNEVFGLKKKNFLDRGEPLFFEMFIQGAINDGKTGVDWAEPKNEKHILDFCHNAGITDEKIDFELLRKTQQRRLEEYGIK